MSRSIRLNAKIRTGQLWNRMRVQLTKIYQDAEGREIGYPQDGPSFASGAGL
jgi:hypothetical protein